MSNTNTATKIDKTKAIDLNNPKCSVYGKAKESNPACKACLANFKARNKACLELTAKTAETKTVKKITGSHLDCFGCNVNEDTHKFIKEVFKNPCTMKAIKACSWNSRPNTFYCKANSMIEKGLLLKNKKSKTYSLSSKGNKLFKKWTESGKVESKKVA